MKFDGIWAAGIANFNRHDSGPRLSRIWRRDTYRLIRIAQLGKTDTLAVADQARRIRAQLREIVEQLHPENRVDPGGFFSIRCGRFVVGLAIGESIARGSDDL